MFSFIFTILSALAISITGAYFSIIGLSTIFPGSKISVIIMGTVLEIAKIVTVLWLHRNWKQSAKILKFYFCSAVLILMGITSLGIFGYLSKAHIEHQNSAISEVIKIENLESRIQKEKSILNQYEKYLNDIVLSSKGKLGNSYKQVENSQQNLKEISSKLKNDVDIEIGRIKDLEGRRNILDEEYNKIKDKPNSIFSNKEKDLKEIAEKQKDERSSILNKIKIHEENIKKFRQEYKEEYKKINDFIDSQRNIDSSESNNYQSRIEEYNDKIKNSMIQIQLLESEKINYGKKIREVEAEIGPLKYVIGMISDFSDKEIDSDQAVRLIILIIMVVFDPLAILLLVAAQTTYFMNKPNIDKVLSIKKKTLKK